ncbi:MAG TPA: hypothetical protein VEA69_02760 [Tepidisphaeraceae bacterium]|nr:hypothetical protein [Tepidisphaeraceae bacterium]
MRDAPVMLSYASPDPRKPRVPWGPGWFAPSRRAVLLLCLAAAFWAWLWWRHAAWERVMEIPQGHAVGPYRFNATYETPFFTADGLIVTRDQRRGVEVWDPATRKRLGTARHADWRACRFYEGGTRYAIVRGDPQAGHYETRTGRRVGSLRTGVHDSFLPPAADGPLEDQAGFSPDGRRMVCMTFPPADDGGRSARRRPALWDVGDPAHSSPRLVAWLAPSAYRVAAFSRNSRWLALAADDGAIHVIDATDGATRSRVPWPWFDGRGWFEVCFSDDGRRIAVLHTTGDGRVRTRVHAVDGGALLFDVTRTAERCWLSADFGRLYALSSSSWTGLLDVTDVGSGALLASRVGRWGAPSFFPDGARFVSRGDRSGPVIFDARTLEPLHELPAEPGPGHLAISADGRWMAGDAMWPAAGGGEAALVVYRRTGWDCPESMWAELALPHLYGLVATFFATVGVLHRDARRRAARTVRAATTFVPRVDRAFARFVLVGVGAIVSGGWLVHVALTHAFGWTAESVLLSTGPVLLITGLGVATGSRAWRWIAVLAVGWVMWELAGPLRTGLRGGGADAGAFGRSVTFYRKTLVAPCAAGVLVGTGVVFDLVWRGRR